MYSTIKKGTTNYVFHGTDKKSLLSTMRKWESENGISVKRHEYNNGTYDNNFWRNLWKNIHIFGFTIKDLTSKDVLPVYIIIGIFLLLSPVISIYLPGSSRRLICSFLYQGYSFIESWFIIVGFVSLVLFIILFICFVIILIDGVKRTITKLNNTIIVC